METIKERIIIREEDLQELRKFVIQGSSDPHIRNLHERLEQASVVPTAPPDVVTLGARFRMRDVETEHVAEYSLVLPSRADVKRGRISVLAPIGALLLGAQENEMITFATPDSTRVFQIESILSD